MISMKFKFKLFEIAFYACFVASFHHVCCQESSDTECNFKTHYLCLNSTKCIPKAYLCNGENDCEEKDDETECDRKKCLGPLYFRCRDGGCVSSNDTCNHISDCRDSSDESDELCEGKHKTHAKCDPDNHFECQAEECIPKKYVCDGKKNCLSGRDEDPEMCKKMNIKCSGFMCKDDSKCITDLSWLCDGMKDCNDGSDESHCRKDCKLEDGYFMCPEGDCIELNKLCDGKKDCLGGTDEAENCNDTSACTDLSCEGECKLLPSGPTCICKKGYLFNNATKKCDDKNECEDFGTCTQGCVNTNGSYYCTCANFFKLKSDNHTCIASGRDALLVYTTPKKIKSIHLNAQFVDDVVNTMQAIGVAFDGKSYYWTEITNGKESIVKLDSETKTKEVLLTAGLETPEDLAIDWLTGNIYFTDANQTRVGVCDSTGFFCTQLVSTDAMDRPRAIALHPAESLLFWTDWGQNPHIGVSFMDGSDAKVLVGDMKWPNGIALDWPNGRLYWTDAKLQTIESVTIAGNDRRTVLADVIKHPFAIAVFEDKLYWSDWDTINIESCNKFTGKDFEPLMQGEYVYDVHIYHEAMMPKQNHACMNHKCSHMCLLGPNRSFSCVCPDDMELVNKFLCQKTKKTEHIILGVGKHIVAIPHQTFGRHAPAEAQEVGISVDIMEFNLLNGEIFIADSIVGRIMTVDLKNEVKTLVENHVLSVNSMAFDYLANNLYWIDSIKSTIEVISLNSKKRAILLHYGKDENPIAMALIPSRGEMFIAFQSIGRIHIDRQSLAPDVHEHFHVIESGLSQDGQINIVVDEKNQLFYWSDSKKMKIEFSNFQGTNIKTFAKLDRKPNQMALIGEEIYWTSLGSKTLQWQNASGSGGAKLVSLEKPPGMSKLPRIIALTAGIPLKASNHPCMINNGGCSDICLSVGPNTRACLCETGHFFKDSSRTLCIKRQQCDFICSTSGECLESSQRCNGKKECLDGLDEKDCDTRPEFIRCKPGQFMCRDGQCISQEQRCDGYFNCRDRTDELNCAATEKIDHCKRSQLRCPNGHCLDVTLRCNGQNDCGDGFDEREDLCQTNCTENFFKCASGQCIPEEFVCNSYIDCIDLSDEHSECPIQMCKYNHRPCPNGWCIDERLFCNGFPDCEDNFDELVCEEKSFNTACDIDEFFCSSNASECLPIGMKCDRKNDCRNGEDEEDCPNCPPYQFECRNGMCIVAKFRCDNANDCGDNSDEDDCAINKTDIQFDQTCAVNQYKCNDETCLEFSKVCDGKKDCQDGDDEDSKTGGKCKTACSSKPCADICLPTPKGAICSCEEGFNLVNGKYCEDIDECGTSNACSQYCNNTNGSFICSCSDGFILGSDKISCKALGSSEIFLFTLNDQIRNFTDFPKSISLVSTERFPIADIDINVKRRKIIYALQGSNTLTEMDVDNNTDKVSYDKVPLVSKITHDWITGNTYTVHHADDLKVKINVCSMQSQNCALIHSLDHHEQVTAIRVDPINKYIFYAQMIDSTVTQPISKIVKMRLDGSDPKVIANGTMIKSLAIDIDQQRVFFTETSTQTLLSIGYEGESSKSLFTQSRTITRPIAMSLFENHAYILQQASQMISRCKLFGNMECHEFDILANNVRKVVIGHSTLQRTGRNSCKNHSCGVVCIPTDLGSKCLSTDGTAVEPMAIPNLLRSETPSESSGFWMWTFIIFIVISASAAAVFLMYRRRGSHGHFNVSMYFQSNEMGKALPLDTKPTPFPRTTTAEQTQASSPLVNIFKKNGHEFINDGHHSFKSIGLNLGSTNASGFSDEEPEDIDNGDVSNDPHQRLIL